MRYFIVYYHGTYSSRSADLSQYVYGDIAVKGWFSYNKKKVEDEIKDLYGLRWVHITGDKNVWWFVKNHYYKK